MKIRKLISIGLAILLAGFLLIQLIPFGHAHDNPPVISEPNWDSPQTREIAQRACFDCHSNDTDWPWYSNVAPVSWLVQHDVDEGRAVLNFSEWGQGGDSEELDELYEVVAEGEMPMANYLVTHPEARLTDAERLALADGLLVTARQSPMTGSHDSGESREEDDD